MLAVASGAAAIGAIGFLFLLLLVILWILVPFAVFGIKPLLRQLLEEQRRTNQLLSGGGQPSVPEFKDPQAGMFGRKG